MDLLAHPIAGPVLLKVIPSPNIPIPLALNKLRNGPLITPLIRLPMALLPTLCVLVMCPIRMHV